MKHGSLFSGIGGFDLAAEWMEWENVFHCEWNEFGQKVLKYYWPKAISYADITKTDFTIHRGTIDVLTGGFPCQPYSQAGKRKGKEDERHLWPEMLRAIGEIQPRWVVGENVRGLVNWNGGLVFDEVQSDLEAKGYQVFPFLLPAAGINAPHERYRIWFISYAGSEQLQEWTSFGNSQDNKKENAGMDYRVKRQGDIRNASYTKCNGGIQGSGEYKSEQFNQNGKTGGISPNPHYERLEGARHIGSLFAEIGNKELGINRRNTPQDWSNWPTQPPVCTGNDGLSPELDGITFPKWRNESIKAGGNAIVPQVALQIFKAIEEYHQLNLTPR